MDDVSFGRGMVVAARQVFEGQVKNVSLEEALFAAGGFRSSLGVLKHIGGWLHVYHSYAFEPEPKHWAQTSWPRGLRDEVDLSKDYFDEVVAWIRQAFDAWDRSLASIEAGTLDQPRPAHFGGKLPLSMLLGIQMFHVTNHLGEVNMLLSIKRGEAWEWGEEVEENHIDTFGHGLRGNWMSDEVAAATEAGLRAAHEARQAAHR
jgi:hypothetical protein